MCEKQEAQTAQNKRAHQCIAIDTALIVRYPQQAFQYLLVFRIERFRHLVSAQTKVDGQHQASHTLVSWLRLPSLRGLRLFHHLKITAVANPRRTYSLSIRHLAKLHPNEHNHHVNTLHTPGPEPATRSRTVSFPTTPRSQPVHTSHIMQNASSAKRQRDAIDPEVRRKKKSAPLLLQWPTRRKCRRPSFASLYPQ